MSDAGPTLSAGLQPLSRRASFATARLTTARAALAHAHSHAHAEVGRFNKNCTGAT